MELVVRHYKDGQAAEERWSDRTLDEAKEIARNWVADGAADLVEIRNAQNELLFAHHPGKHDA